MTTSTDTFETVQHYDHPTNPLDALTRHVTAELQADIDTARRGYMLQASNGARDWVVESYPAGHGTARNEGVYFDNGDGTCSPVSVVSDHFPYADDFPCCANGLCHTCGGTGTVAQTARCGDCDGAGFNA